MTASIPINSSAEVHHRPLPYVEELKLRSADAIQGVVIHATELPDLAMARQYGERAVYESGTGNSGHFYIDRSGRMEQWVPLERVAHHVRGHNHETIGIELVNGGRYPEWLASESQVWTEPYPDAQIKALTDLVVYLNQALPNLEWIAGHVDLDQERVPASDDASVQVRRKLDPGITFPWDELMKHIELERFEPNR